MFDKKHISVILPLPLPRAFTYAVPDALAEKVRVGMRVIVPFGKKKLYTAIVQVVHNQPPATIYAVKEIVGLLDQKPVVRHPQLQFWQWISDYYCAAIGDVYQAAVPSGLKLQSETQVTLNADFGLDTQFTDREYKILDALADGKSKTIDELTKLADVKNIMPTVTKLLNAGAIFVSENLFEKFKEKKEKFVRINDALLQNKNLENLFSELSRAPKQLDLLMKMIDFSRCLTNKPLEISKKELLQKSNCSDAVLNSLIGKNVFAIYEKKIGRLDLSEIHTDDPVPLNDFQQRAYSEIRSQFVDKQVVLLNGVTSSGKTEIYIHLIKKCVERDNQALFLVPEIALTTQLTSRLRRIFGNRLGVYHSKFSDAERVEVWNHLLNDTAYDVIIGVRSSIFLPFRKLGLVIIDEEHELSYKQFDPAPRYHARSAAIVLAQMHGAKTLLGTATPAVESFFNARTAKFGFVEMKERFGQIQLPDIQIIDTKEAYRKKEMRGFFSEVLLEEMEKTLKNGAQIILFQNRRGYAPYMECRVCGYVPHCKNCDVSLTVHRLTNTLTCHYCGYSENITSVCPACGTLGGLTTRGFGTEKIEDEIGKIFPQARVARMDLDTTRSRKNYETLICDFENHKIDILAGTQMISKGLDFQNVSLVGVLNADNLLNFPDFRAAERAFQMLVQVSGRAGRKNSRGTVIIQTSQPENSVIEQIICNDYEKMFETQIVERRSFRYPPFVRLMQISVRHKDETKTQQAANFLADVMRKVFGGRVLGPNTPAVSRIQNLYIKQILLKIEVAASAEKAKKLLAKQIAEIFENKDFKSVLISVDIDPM
ncbi:MAG: primosomal protein N' [Prevotellaceae bacterium]|jgi:primosomal protein N' (replication factor Y)|nr:primosomal protein N' [Prevotellaceae bacterium]